MRGVIVTSNRGIVLVLNPGRSLHRVGGNHGLFAPGIAQDHAAAGKGAQRHACREDNQQDGFLPGTTHFSMIGREQRHVQD